MELLFNDASLHGQFDIPSFRRAIDRIMTIRQTGLRYGRELQCNRNVANAQITYDRKMPEVIQFLRRDKRSAVQLWLTRTGPFWDESRDHSENDWMECNGRLVTGTAIAEATHAVLHERLCGLVSVDPSEWLISPLSIDCRTNSVEQSTSVNNYWTIEDLEKDLEAAPVSIQSWADLEKTASSRFSELTFTSSSFEPLSGHPYGKGAAERILELLRILAKFKDCFDASGRRTGAGNHIYQEYFTGNNAPFSDSSDSEKNDFRAQLTFPHPDVVGEALFCTWHGKVRTQQLRVHFSWPIRAAEPLYIMYIGPKITKR